MNRILAMLSAGLALLVQDPPKTIELPTLPTYTLSNREASGMILRDVNGDGFPDLICSGSEGGRPAQSVMYLSNKGRFTSISWKTGNYTVSRNVVLADLTGDGLEEIFITGYNNQPAMAYRNLGKGHFETEPFWKSADTDWGLSVIAGDFNGDGFQDVLCDGRLYHGTKSGLSTVHDWKIEGNACISKSLLADIDLDGRPDLVTTDWLGGPAYCVYRAKERDFETTPSFRSSRRGEFTSLAAGDIDGDGFPEIIVGASTFRGGDGCVRMYLNDRGKPAAEPTWTSADVDCDADDVALADFDGDGDLDLLVIAEDHSAIHENQGGTLEAQPIWRATIKGAIPRIADLDKDGRLDIVVCGREVGIAVHMGAPQPGAAKAQQFPTIPILPALTRKDLLPDGDPEVEALVAQYRRTPSAESLAELKQRAPAALTAIEAMDDGTLDSRIAELRPAAGAVLDSWVKALASEELKIRERALANLIGAGSNALPALRKAGESGDPEQATRARLAIQRIDANLRDGVAIDLLGMKVVRLTERLRKRYGLQELQGIVVLEVPEHVGPGLGLSNIREGDLIVGIGDRGEYGRQVDPVYSAVELPGMILKQDHLDEDPIYKDSTGDDRGWRLAGYRYVCGPLHPTQAGKVRQWRMSFSLAQWQNLKEAMKSPRPWLPEK